MAIARMKDLSPDAVEVETRAIELVSQDAPRLIEEYRRRFGVTVATDLARELFPEYSASIETKLKYAAAVQKSAASLADMVYETILAEERGGAALFTAGGTGAGKTSAILRNMERTESMFGTRVIYDSNFNSFKSSLKKIELALAVGCKVSVIFVHRHPVEAYLEGVIPRAGEQGRTVSIEGHLRMHKDSMATFLKAQRRMEDNENVAFTVLVNTGHESETFQADIDYLKTVKYDDDVLFAAIRKGLDDVYSEGKITKTLYEISRGGA